MEAARDTEPISGLTHGFYRFPALFSPVFVRTAIEEFTQPGDSVFDPFVGGGTTLFEAMALGRNALGIEISSLSAFVCEAKTQILSTLSPVSTYGGTVKWWIWRLVGNYPTTPTGMRSDQKCSKIVTDLNDPSAIDRNP